MIHDSLYSSRSEEWETPHDLFVRLDMQYQFTLDVCATEQNKKVECYFDAQQDGLKQAWSGNVWMNPPYGKTMPAWMQKAYEQRINCNVIVCLVPARTDTRWFHDWVYGKAEILFLKGRLKFGGSKNSAPFPSMLVIYRQDSKPMVPVTLLFHDLLAGYEPPETAPEGYQYLGSVYGTDDGFEVSTGLLHSGSIFHGQVEFDPDTIADLKRAKELNIEASFVVRVEG